MGVMENEGVTAGSQGVTADPLVSPPNRRLASTIENMPAAIRDKVKDMLVSGSSTRDVSAFLTGRGYKLSHAAVARYKKFVLLPALETTAYIARSQTLARNPDASETEILRETQDVTKQVLTAGPLVARASQLWSEVLEGVDESKAQWETDPETGRRKLVATSDLKARAALIQAGRGLIETEAKLLGVGSFGQQAQAGSGTTIQIAIAMHSNDGKPSSVDICELKR